MKKRKPPLDAPAELEVTQEEIQVAMDLDYDCAVLGLEPWFLRFFGGERTLADSPAGREGDVQAVGSDATDNARSANWSGSLIW